MQYLYTFTTYFIHLRFNLIYCPEGAFCVEKPKKLDVCTSAFCPDLIKNSLLRFVTLSNILRFHAKSIIEGF